MDSSKENESQLTHAIASKLFSYDSDTGRVTRKINTGGRGKFGDVVGYAHGDYLRVKRGGIQYLLHRVCWLIYYGKWPEGEIDHINGIGTDNRISNLRAVTKSGNQRNRKRNKLNTTGATGVWFEKNKYRASIYNNSKRVDLGCYETLEKAANARKMAEVLYGYHENHGRVL